MLRGTDLNKMLVLLQMLPMLLLLLQQPKQPLQGSSKPNLHQRLRQYHQRCRNKEEKGREKGEREENQLFLGVASTLRDFTKSKSTREAQVEAQISAREAARWYHGL